MKDIKKMIRNFIIFIALIVLTFGLIFKDQDMGKILDIIRTAKIQYICLGILAMIAYFIFESVNIRRILKSLGENTTILKALKYTLIGFFFSAITPAASGGQPMEIYYMYKDGHSRSYSITALLVQLCCFQIVTISVGIFSAIFNASLLQNGVLYFFLLGVTVNSIGLTIMLICLFSKTTSKKLIHLVVKILKFFKYKKIEEKQIELEEGLEKYNEGSDFIKKNKSIFVKSLLIVLLQMACYYSVAYFVYRALGLNGHSMFRVMTVQALLYCTVSGLPLPGAVGASESAFLQIYTSIFGSALLNSAMLLTRGINFYLFVAICAILVMINVVKGKKRKEV